MNRLFSGVLGVLLLLSPAWILFRVMAPVPQYRTGTFADHSSAARAGFILYGGAGVGILVQRWNKTRRQQTLKSQSVFRACLLGAITASVLALFEAGGGNLWGLLLIFGAAFGSVIGAGAALLWRALLW